MVVSDGLSLFRFRWTSRGDSSNVIRQLDKAHCNVHLTRFKINWLLLLPTLSLSRSLSLSLFDSCKSSSVLTSFPYLYGGGVAHIFILTRLVNCFGSYAAISGHRQYRFVLPMNNLRRINV